MTAALTLPKSLIIFDLDGVVYRGDTPTPGAAQTITALQSSGLIVRFLTNNSSQTRQSYVKKLAGMDITADDRSIMTSAYATAQFLLQKGLKGRIVLVVGEQGLVDELRLAGLDALAAGTGGSAAAAAVVVGIDRTFTYEKLMEAQQAIFRGALFIATNRDATFPTEAGNLPGGGSIVAAVAVASGHEPELVGKPNLYSLDLVLQSCGVAREKAVLVGDRLDTDIDVGRRAGLETVLPLTGVSTREAAEGAPDGQGPTVIIQDLRDLPRLLHAASTNQPQPHPAARTDPK